MFHYCHWLQVPTKNEEQVFCQKKINKTDKDKKISTNFFCLSSFVYFRMEYSRDLLQCFFLIIAILHGCTCHRSKFLSVLKDKKLFGFEYLSLSGLEEIKCVYECSKSDGKCSSVNYESSSKTCILNRHFTEDDKDVKDGRLISSTGWKYFEKSLSEEV